MSFSKREGIEPIDIPLQLDGINYELRVMLWNVFYNRIFQYYEDINTFTDYDSALRLIWYVHLKKPIDEYDMKSQLQIKSIYKSIFFNGKWNKIYDFFEYLLTTNLGSIHIDADGLSDSLNRHLKNESAGYRVLAYKFVKIINKEEIDEIKNTFNQTQEDIFRPIQEHLSTSIKLISNRTEPDYRNSIKESISMVESISRIISPNSNTLGKALKNIKETDDIPNVLIEAFEKLYGYTNGKDGIRHSIMDSSTVVKKEEAQFFLISCSAFTNYLIEKYRKMDT